MVEVGHAAVASMVQEVPGFFDAAHLSLDALLSYYDFCCIQLQFSAGFQLCEFGTACGHGTSGTSGASGANNVQTVKIRECRMPLLPLF